MGDGAGAILMAPHPVSVQVLVPLEVRRVLRLGSKLVPVKCSSVDQGSGINHEP